MRGRRLCGLTALVLVLTGALSVGPAAAPASAIAPYGYSLQLDGVDDYADTADHTSVDLGDADGEDFTIEASVYVPDETGEAVQVIAYKQYAYRLSVNFNTASDDVLILGVWGAPTGTGDEILGYTSIGAGWHHVAGTFDNTSGSDTLAVWLDGSLVYSSSAAAYSPGISNSGNLLSVGANSGAVPWNGWIDEMRFSDVVRYTGAYTVPAAPFTADASTRTLWHFDEPVTSTVFADSSGDGITLTGHNGAQTGLFGAGSPTVQLSAASYVVSESAGTATVTVARSGDPVPVVGVDYATTDGTATAGSDYTDTSGTLSFAAGDTSETFTVPITGDTAFEGDETIGLTLSSPTGGASLGTPSTGQLTITDDDGAPQLAFYLVDNLVGEGDVTGTADVSVVRTGDQSGTVGVDWATSDGSATAGADYTASSGTLTFGPGVTYRTFEVPIANDALYEGADETVGLTLSNPSGGAGLGTPSAATLTILDDDESPELFFLETAYTVDEDAGSALVTVQRVRDASMTIEVDYATSGGSATPGADYTETSGTLTFLPAADGTESFTVPVIDDATPEGPESVTLTLSNPTNGATLGTPATVTLTINDNEPASAIIAFEQATPTVGEDAGTVELTVLRSGNTGVAASVTVTHAGGTATQADVSLTAGTLTFAAGETTRTVGVVVNDDTWTEGAETLVVRLAPSGPSVVGSPDSVTVTIAPSDQLPDVLVSRAKRSKYAGDDVFNTSGAGQTRSAKVRRGTTVSFWVRVYNDGNVTNDLVVRGTKARRQSKVRYYVGARNVTAEMVSRAGRSVTLAPHAFQLVEVRITVLAKAPAGARKLARVSATWTGDCVNTDLVKAVVTGR